MDASSARISALCVGKWSVELAMLTEAATRETDHHLVDHRRQTVLAMIGTLRKELTELECAIKGELLPIPTAPRPSLKVVGASGQRSAS